MSRVGDLSGPSHMHLASHVCLCMLSMSLIVVSANVDALDSYVHVQPIRPELGSLAHSPSNVASPAWACLHPGFQGTGLFQDVRTDPTSTSSPPLTLSWPTDQSPHSFSRAAASFRHVCRRLFVLWLSSRTYAIASSSYRIPMQSRNARYGARYPPSTISPQSQRTPPANHPHKILLLHPSP